MSLTQVSGPYSFPIRTLTLPQDIYWHWPVETFATLPLIMWLGVLFPHVAFPSQQVKALLIVLPTEGQSYYHSICYQQWDPSCFHMSEKFNYKITPKGLFSRTSSGIKYQPAFLGKWSLSKRLYANASLGVVIPRKQKRGEWGKRSETEKEGKKYKLRALLS